MKNIVITIGREYGSGGKYIGEQVAKRLNINFYDKELLQKAYDKNGCSYSKLSEYDESKRNYILKTFSLLNTNEYENAFEDDMYQLIIKDTIKDIANCESCVIIGRNSNKVLENYDNTLNLFIYSNDIEFKIKRKMEIENISYKEALNRLKFVDNKRKKYYEYLNKYSKWGDKKEYDFCIDSSIFGINGTIDLIVDMYKKMQNG